MKNLVLLTPVLAIACLDVKPEETGTTTEDTAEVVVADPSFSVTWGSSDVSLAITDGTVEYHWGMAENAGTCVDAGWCWTGEDCFLGYDLTDGGNLSYCHPVSATGGSLTYGADTAAVTEGSSTVFSDNGTDWASVVTHIVDDRNAGPCWTWGADTSYYSGYDKTCTAM